MSTTQHAFTVGHYGPRASAYVSSAVHSAGQDLDQIEDLVRGRTEARVLDLGAGGGHVSYRVAPHVREVVACDLTSDMLAEIEATARKRGLGNVSVRQAAAEALPFPDGAFDVVLCRYSTHHWHDAGAGLREARRVLAPPGFAIFADAVAPAHPVLDTHLQALEVLRDASHVRNYTLAQWVDVLARAGFETRGLTTRKVRMEFDVWTARTKTPSVHVAALTALQAGASEAVRSHFAIGPDGSFDLDTTVIEAAPALV